VDIELTMPAAKKLSIDEQVKHFDAIRDRREKLRAALSAYVHRNGGWVTSSVIEPRLRIECPQFSELPDRLHDLGYNLQPAGTNTRATAQGLVPVVCYSFTISASK
jgi:hypothetical protein